MSVEYPSWKALLARLDSNNLDQDKNSKTEAVEETEEWKTSVVIKYCWSNRSVFADIDNF